MGRLRIFVIPERIRIVVRFLTITEKMDNIERAYARNPVEIRNSHHYCKADDGAVATGSKMPKPGRRLEGRS